jgi:hypothetical protein
LSDSDRFGKQRAAVSAMNRLAAVVIDRDVNSDAAHNKAAKMAP